MDVRVNSWIELQEAVFADSWRPRIERFRSSFVFRGVPRVTHTLDTSLQTGGFVGHEKHLLTSFRKYAVERAVHGDWVWNWLSLAKHHGLPTRLLAGRAAQPAGSNGSSHHPPCGIKVGSAR